MPPTPTPTLAPASRSPPSTTHRLRGGHQLWRGCPEGLDSCTVEQLKQSSPLTYISSARKLPAFLIGQIPIEQSQLLYSALQKEYADVTLHTLHGEGHFFPFTDGLSEPCPAQTVQTSKGCGKTGTSTGPALSLDIIGSFFRAHLR
jgi:hypothetical protein